MRHRAGSPLVFAFLLLTGCSQPVPTPSALQKYQQLKPRLAQSGLESARVASDSARVEKNLRRQHFRGAARDAGKLAGDARGLAKIVGTLRSRVFRLSRLASRPGVQRYLRFIQGVWADEQREANALIGVARLVRSDPSLVRGRDAGMLTRLDRGARAAASAAVAAVEAAARWKRKHARLFRYTPVRG